MNATEAINKIADLLGLKFKSEKFMVTKLVDGSTEITNNQEGPFTVGEGLFVVGENSVLVPAPAGSHETREGLILTVGEDSIISKIEEKPVVEESNPVIDAATDVEIETEVLSSATLTDGTKIETDEEGDFAVGQKLYVITESGERVSAPEGEHVTESGITLVVSGEGVITGVKYPDEDGEGSLEDMKSDMKNMKQAMTEMLSMLNKFSKDFESYKNDYEEFKNSPVHTEPVVRKTFGKENIMDAKVRFLRDALRN
jgi:hypothetical protein